MSWLTAGKTRERKGRSMKRVAIIGANEFQNPLIEKARELGLETHVFAWQDGSIGERTADCFHPISIVETDRILDACRHLGVSAVCSIGSDLAAITVVKVAGALGLPCNPPETAVLATNKYRMREAFRDAGIPVPAFFKADGAEKDLEQARALRFPVIVKPTDRSGSRGITKVDRFDPDRLRAAVAAALKESFEKRAVIEEYLEGPEYSCEALSVDGQHTVLAITKKYTTGAPHFIETGHIEPPDLTQAEEEKVHRAVTAGLDALHVRLGASHSEFRIDPGTGEARLIEIGARMGGDCIGSDLVRLSTGVDFVELTLRAALGECPKPEAQGYRRAALVRFLFTQSDLERFHQIEKERPDLLVRASGMRQPGSAVTDSSTRLGFYILSGEDREELVHWAQLEERL